MSRSDENVGGRPPHSGRDGSDPHVVGERLSEPVDHAVVSVHDSPNPSLANVVAGASAFRERPLANQPRIGSVEALDVLERKPAIVS